MRSRPNTSVEALESGLAHRVILFSRFLKTRGFKAFSTSAVGALRGLGEIDVSVETDFFSVLRMNLAHSDLEWRLFWDLYHAFWGQALEGLTEGRGDEPRRQNSWELALLEEMDLQGSRGGQDRSPEDSTERDFLEGISYSPVSQVEKKDLSRFHAADIPIAQLVLRNIMSPFRVTFSRRLKRSRRPGHIDFPRVMRKGLKSEGLPLPLLFKKKKKRLKRLVVLADVSGSMERYALFVMPFILGMRGIGSRAEVFVFSTSLTLVTHVIRKHALDKVLEMIAREVPDWSGGTRIGYSLHQLNDAHGQRLLNRRAVVVILSDGWDLGAKNLLKKEMQNLSARVHAVIWLNPLAADPEQSGLSRPMQSILPFVDILLPADSLQSLTRVGRTLSRIVAQ